MGHISMASPLELHVLPASGKTVALSSIPMTKFAKSQVSGKKSYANYANFDIKVLPNDNEQNAPEWEKFLVRLDDIPATEPDDQIPNVSTTTPDVPKATEQSKINDEAMEIGAQAEDEQGPFPQPEEQGT